MKTPNFHDQSKLRRNRLTVSLEILRSKYAIFAEAAEELTRRTGQPATAEDMMTFDLERSSDPNDLADMYCWSVLKWTTEQIDQFSDHATGRARVLRKTVVTKPAPGNGRGNRRG